MDAKTNGALRAHPMPGIYDASRDQIGPVDNYYDAGGLTKRELFAAMAMQGLCARKTPPSQGWAGKLDEAFAREAVDRADALLAALTTESAP
jgi:hypothetical protein